MSSQATSWPSVSATRLYRMGTLSPLRSCLKLGLRFSVAVYIDTGIETSPKLMAPFQIERAMGPVYAGFALSAQGDSGSHRVEQIAEGAEVGVDPQDPLGGGEQLGHVLGQLGCDARGLLDDFGELGGMGGADDHCRVRARGFLGHRPGGGGVGIEGEPSPLMYPADRGDDGVVAEPTGLERLPQPGVDLRRQLQDTSGAEDVLHLPDRAGCFSNRLVQVSLEVRRNLDVHRRRHRVLDRVDT